MVATTSLQRCGLSWSFATGQMGAADEQRQHFVAPNSNPKQYMDQVIQLRYFVFTAAERQTVPSLNSTVGH
jgi:hypothetical protein